MEKAFHSLCTKILTEIEFKLDFLTIVGVEFPNCIHAKAIEKVLENGMYTEQMNEREDKFLNVPMDKVNNLYEKIRDSELIDENRIALAQLINEKMNRLSNIGKNIYQFNYFQKIKYYRNYSHALIYPLFSPIYIATGR